MIETPTNNTFIFGTTESNILGPDPQLLSLRTYGGATPTQALRHTSPAIDKGNSFGVGVDQRGQPRPLDYPNTPNSTGGDGSDIGAFEAAAPTSANVSISGRVITPQGFGLTRVLITLTDSRGQSRTILTGKFGNFRFVDVTAGEIYIITVASKRYTCAPQVIAVMEDMTGVNFAPYPLQ